MIVTFTKLLVIKIVANVRSESSRNICIFLSASVPGLENAREGLVCDGDGRVSLVVFEQYVVARFIALDEVVF